MARRLRLAACAAVLLTMAADPSPASEPAKAAGAPDRSGGEGTAADADAPADAAAGEADADAGETPEPDEPPPPEPLSCGELVPDFAIRDVNPQSDTFGRAVSPRDYLGDVSAWYFGHSTCAYCRNQFGHLDEIADELLAEPSPRAIHLLGVGGNGGQRANPRTVAGRRLPWLQNEPGADVWTRWCVEWRDIVILDAENRVVAIYNVTAQSLRDGEHRERLKELLRDAAAR